MKKAYIFLGFAIAILVYLLTKKSNSTVVGVTGSNGNTFLDSLLGNTQKDSTANSNENAKSTDTNDTTTNTDTPTVTKGATEQLSFTYKGGQHIFNKYDGILHPSGTIGYLSDGTLLYSVSVTFNSSLGEYVDKIGSTGTNPYNSSGVNLNSSIGRYLINGGYINVYADKKNVVLGDYGNALGYLSDGTVVYIGIINAGTENESTYLYL